LTRHGLEFAATGCRRGAFNRGRALILGAGAVSGLPGPDGAAYVQYLATMARFGAALQPLFERAPPRLGTSARADRMGLLRLGWQIRRLGRPRMRELLRIGAMNVYDLLQEHFSDSRLQGALASTRCSARTLGRARPARCSRCCAASPRRCLRRRRPDAARGGLGALSAALALAASTAGAEIRTSAAVARILVQEDRACGVQLRSGEQIRAGSVVSSADPKSTLLGLLGAEHLDTGFVRRVHHMRSRA